MAKEFDRLQSGKEFIDQRIACVQQIMEKIFTFLVTLFYMQSIFSAFT